MAVEAACDDGSCTDQGGDLAAPNSGSSAVPRATRGSSHIPASRASCGSGRRPQAAPSPPRGAGACAASPGLEGIGDDGAVVEGVASKGARGSARRRRRRRPARRRAPREVRARPGGPACWSRRGARGGTGAAAGGTRRPSGPPAARPDKDRAPSLRAGSGGEEGEDRRGGEWTRTVRRCGGGESRREVAGAEAPRRTAGWPGELAGPPGAARGCVTAAGEAPLHVAEGASG